MDRFREIRIVYGRLLAGRGDQLLSETHQMILEELLQIVTFCRFYQIKI